MNAFDDRLVTLTISLNDQVIATYDQNFYIIATGRSYTNGLGGELSLRIDNISKTVRDQLVTATSQFRNPKKTVATVSLSVGRESYGTFQIFIGVAIACNPTQPPDIGLTIRSLSSQQLWGIPNSFTAPSMASVQSICQQVANAAGLTLDYQATTNPSIGNYRFTGAVGKQIQKLNALGVSAYIPSNSNTLVVTDYLAPRNLPTVQINSSTGLIGVPQVSEVGVTCRVLITNEIQLGAPIQLTSTLNPAANGMYILNNLGYEIASRDTPYYWLLNMSYQAAEMGQTAS